VTQLAEGEKSYTSGVNDFRRSGYDGRMPPEGHGLHHYFVWIQALDFESDFAPGLSLEGLLGAIEPNVIEMNRLHKGVVLPGALAN